VNSSAAIGIAFKCFPVRSSTSWALRIKSIAGPRSSLIVELILASPKYSLDLLTGNKVHISASYVTCQAGDLHGMVEFACLKRSSQGFLVVRLGYLYTIVHNEL